MGNVLKEVCQYVDVLDVNTNEVKRYDAAVCQFGYRDSIFKHQLKDIKTTSENSLDEKNTTINYSKYNSFIFKASNNNSFNKKQNNIYNTLKFGLALLLVVFILISL